MEAALEALKSFAESTDQATRRILSNKLRDFAVTLETPTDTLQRVCYQPIELMIAQVAVDLGLFKVMSKSDKPQTSTELAEACGAEPLLMQRLLRYLSSFRFVKETGEETWEATHVTKLFSQPGYEDGIWFHFHFYNPALMATPKFLKDTNYRNPDNNTSTPLLKAFDTELPPFIWLHQNPEYLAHFAQFMGHFHDGKASWTSVVPIQEECKALPSSDPERPLFVDIGGGLGFQSAVFRKAAEGIEGKVILQDLKETLDEAPNHEGVEKMVHDFFQPNPVKGAKYYYLRNILHDYPDNRAVNIIKTLIPAMGPDSVMLIDEMIIPNTGAHNQAVQQDMAMMITQSSIERSEKQWRKLLDEAGVEIKKMSVYGLLSNDAVIEVVPRA